MSQEGWHSRLSIAAGSASIVGKVRDHNEDAELVLDELHLYAVADGLGGHQAGERASSLAVVTLAEHLAAARLRDEPPSLDLILTAFDEANSAILQDTVEHPERAGMGTTLTAAVVTGERLLLGHVGDSRAWRVRDGVVTQLSRDHTVVGQQVRDGVLTEEEAATHPMRHILSRCLGVREELEVDLMEMDVDIDDVYVLASDGLEPGVTVEDIREVIAENPEPEVAALVMVNRACDRGGQDNITAVVVACREP
jgi:protein phosphatase